MDNNYIITLLNGLKSKHDEREKLVNSEANIQADIDQLDTELLSVQSDIREIDAMIEDIESDILSQTRQD